MMIDNILKGRVTLRESLGKHDLETLINNGSLSVAYIRAYINSNSVSSLTRGILDIVSVFDPPLRISLDYYKNGVIEYMTDVLRSEGTNISGKDLYENILTKTMRGEMLSRYILRYSKTDRDTIEEVLRYVIGGDTGAVSFLYHDRLLGDMNSLSLSVYTEWIREGRIRVGGAAYD